MSSNPDHQEVDVSVVICAYNAETRLTEGLEALAGQRVSEDLAWEVVLVDNNSSDNTRQVALDFQRNRKMGNLRVVDEPQQGLMYARRRGFLASTGRIISYLDDDNVVNAEWVNEIKAFFDAHPKTGIVGPKILPLTDFKLPAHYEYVKIALAIRDLGDRAIQLTPPHHGPPPGAGMTCLREAVKDIFRNSNFSVVGRQGDELSSCEDSVTGFQVLHAGWELWYNPRMTILHRLPRCRFEMDYLARLFKGMGSSAAEVKAEELGRRLTLWDHFSCILGLAARCVKYGLLGLVGVGGPVRRRIRRMTTAMFFAGLRSHCRSMVCKSPNRLGKTVTRGSKENLSP